MKLKSYCAKTHQGPYLQLNEDNVEVDLLNELYLVFDGFGGSSIGDKCVEKLNNTIKKFFTNIGGDPDSTFPFYYSTKYLLEGNALVNAMMFAHEELKEDNEKLEMNERGGASCVAVAQSENILTLVGTGNCSAYLYRKGEIREIIRPDNFENIGHDNYLRHFLSIPSSGFGLFEKLHFSLKELRVLENDLILMLSDGVYSRITDGEIKFILEKSNISENEKINELFTLANSRGNKDNQSTIILQY